MVSIEILVNRFKRSFIVELLNKERYRNAGLSIEKEIDYPGYDCKMIIAANDEKDLNEFFHEAARLGFVEKG